MISHNGQSIYYVELTGNPVVLEINPSTLAIVSESTAKLFDSEDFSPHVEGATDNLLFLSAESKLAGKAVHIIALDRRDVSKTVIDRQISKRPGWGESYALSYGGDSLWMGGRKYWLRIGLKSGQIEAKMQAQNDVNSLVAFPSGLVGVTNLSSTGFLQLFDKQGHQLKTLVGPGCGFVSVSLSPNDEDGVAVCEKTGATEWSFGKTLERKAVVFDLQTMVAIKASLCRSKALKLQLGQMMNVYGFRNPSFLVLSRMFGQPFLISQGS